MHKIITLLTFALLTTQSLPGSEKTEVMGPIQQFANSLNKGDIKIALTACADDICIIDEIAPYEWHGPGACARWIEDFGADAKKNGIAEPFVTLRKPRHVDVIEERAYVALPADYSYKQNGKRQKEAGQFTVALQKGADGWRIKGWAWSKR